VLANESVARRGDWRALGGASRRGTRGLAARVPTNERVITYTATRGERCSIAHGACARGGTARDLPVRLVSMTSRAAKVHGQTIDDLLAIPESRRRHEIIAGDLVEKDAASGRHGGAQGRLFRKLGPYDRRPGGRWPGGWWFATEVEVMLARDEVYRPDIAGWRREHLVELPSDVPIAVRPDWVCEVLSSNKRNDLVKKKRGYHRYGVPHYWIIDPADETLSVHRWTTHGYVEVLVADRTETEHAEPVEAVDLRVGVMFGDDDEE
jgi:Uma2 family endonuclease